MRSTYMLLACLLSSVCSSPEREEVRSRSYEPLSAADFAAGDATRHGALVQRERDRVLVERVSGVALEGAGLHILQPLRDVVMAREFPASVVAADGLSRAEAERLLGTIAPERPGLP